MITPVDNRKLKIFHLIVACCFYVDFFVTGCILGNYEFINMKDKNEYFLDHEAYFESLKMIGHDEGHEHNSMFTNVKIYSFLDHGTIYFYIIAI